MGRVLLSHVLLVVGPSIGGPITPMENNLAIVFATTLDDLVDVFAFHHFTGGLTELLDVVKSATE